VLTASHSGFKPAGIILRIASGGHRPERFAYETEHCCVTLLTELLMRRYMAAQSFLLSANSYALHLVPRACLLLQLGSIKLAAEACHRASIP
jgi:hypothetical protein